jgi:hypothetical protein
MTILILLFFIFKLTSSLKIVGDFSFCPNYLPGKCLYIGEIVIVEEIIDHCTIDLMCNFFVNEKLVQGFLFNNYVIRETTELTNCSFPFYKLLHNMQNLIYIQRFNKTYYFNILNNKDVIKIYSEEIFLLISYLILAIIALLFVAYIGLDFYALKFKGSLSITGDKNNAIHSICPNISSNIC